MVMARYLTIVVRTLHGCEVYVVMLRSSAGHSDLMCFLTGKF